MVKRAIMSHLLLLTHPAVYVSEYFIPDAQRCYEDDEAEVTIQKHLYQHGRNGHQLFFDQNETPCKIGECRFPGPPCTRKAV